MGPASLNTLIRILSAVLPAVETVLLRLTDDLTIELDFPVFRLVLIISDSQNSVVWEVDSFDEWSRWAGTFPVVGPLDSELLPVGKDASSARLLITIGAWELRVRSWLW